MSTDASENQIPNLDADIAANIQDVKSKIKDVLLENNRPEDSVRLVAVSKTKPIPYLMAAYNTGQRHFGENYAQELLSKAEEMPKDIKWHFIGPLQSNKASALVKGLGLDKLACIETVSTLKLANKLSNAVKSLKEETHADDSTNTSKLGIYIQVNTSGEDTKSGVSSVSETVDLVKEIVNSECNEHLSVDGLMTIGAPGDFTCFEMLVECRKAVAEELGVEESSLALSMGMSGDFEEAIKRGATSVRVGSTIFGARDYSKK
jgi:pyridoxal phosphate enzyme (YggS family)